MTKKVHLREVDRVEITVLVDNYTDMLLIEGTENVKRAALPPSRTLLAEHGLSMLIRVYADNEEYTLIFDAGLTPVPLTSNLRALELDPTSAEGVVLSHGHVDHFGGLYELLAGLNKGVSLTLHPDAFLERRLNIAPLNVQVEMPRLDESSISRTGARLNRITEPTAIAADTVLALGEVERVTDFEKGFPWAEARIDGAWITDPFRDDQGLAVNVAKKGLVVIGGCSHAGIVNTVMHARKVTGVKEVEAVLGGFHLTGPLFEPVIGPTIEEMKKIAPRHIVPMHCTGWKATTEFAARMPDQFLLNAVGTTYVFP